MPARTDNSDVLHTIVNEHHLGGLLIEALARCRHRLFIATANVKDTLLPAGPDSRSARGVFELLAELAERGVEVRLLHSAVPSGPFLRRLKQGTPAGMTMRRCPRVHAKAVIADGRLMYLGSANLTGAGLGAKSAARRNFEAGIWTDDVSLIDPVVDMLEAVWSGEYCRECGRRDYCPVPLEEPDL